MDNINKAQRAAYDAQVRQANALEALVALVKGIAASMGVDVEEPKALPAPEDVKESYNPYTEKAPGVALEGQEAEKAGDMYGAENS